MTKESKENKPANDLGGRVDSLVMRKTPNKSMRVKRVATNERELVFAESWANECDPKKGFGNGLGLIQDLFVYRKNDNPCWEIGKIIWLTKREKMVAATVVQWLGTNCGWGFLIEVLSKLGYKVVKIDDA